MSRSLRRKPIFFAPCLWPKQLSILLVCRIARELFVLLLSHKVVGKQLKNIGMETWAWRGNGVLSVLRLVPCGVRS